MNKEEMQMFQTIFKLGIGECYSEDIKKYGQLDKKILNILEQQKERIAYLESNWNELKEWLKLWVEEEKKLDDLVTTDYSLGDLIEDKEVVLEKMQEIESRK